MHAHRHQPLSVRRVDRLSAVRERDLAGALAVALVASALALVACDSGDKKSPVHGRQRVEGVAAEVSADKLLAEFCDAMPGTKFVAPELADGASLVPTKGWQWVNLWATWCKPCVEEMPRIVKWQQKWKAEGLEVALSFVATDEEASLIDDFRKAHPDAPASFRSASGESIKSWFAALGADLSSLPVHVLVNPAGTVVCVRAAAVEDRDERTVRSLVQPAP